VMRAADTTYQHGSSDHRRVGRELPPAGGRPQDDHRRSEGDGSPGHDRFEPMDGGSEGMFMTNRLLNEARITHAGSGKDLAEARRAQVGMTPKGTIGVVGMYSIDPSPNPAWTRYTDARDKWPGLNPLHVPPTTR
jgi:Bacterial capsule synthesis protein PGA_cap